MLDKLAASIWPVLRKDSIPAIDRPQFISADQADQYLSADEYVFGLSYKGTHRAYPQLVLCWHEIVDDVIEGEPVTVTYCPLTASARGFRDSSSPEGTPETPVYLVSPDGTGIFMTRPGIKSASEIRQLLQLALG